MDEVEAATASITQQNSEEETDDILNSVTLEHSAEQILNGIKREVEVQYLVPMMVTNNDHDTNQQSQQVAQTELQCPFKESGKERLFFHILDLKIFLSVEVFLNVLIKQSKSLQIIFKGTFVNKKT